MEKKIVSKAKKIINTTYSKKHITLYIGKDGSGKRDELKNDIKRFLAKKECDGNVIVVCDNPDEYKKFKKRVIVIRAAQDWGRIYEQIGVIHNVNDSVNNLLIFDCFAQSRFDFERTFISILCRMTQLRFDCIIVLESYRDISPKIICNTTFIKLFETTSSINNKSRIMIGDYGDIVTLAERCLYFSLIQDFKYVLVDLEKEKITCDDTCFFHGCMLFASEQLKHGGAKGVHEYGVLLTHLSRFA